MATQTNNILATSPSSLNRATYPHFKYSTCLSPNSIYIQVHCSNSNLKLLEFTTTMALEDRLRNPALVIWLPVHHHTKYRYANWGFIFFSSEDCCTSERPRERKSYDSKTNSEKWWLEGWPGAGLLQRAARMLPRPHRSMTRSRAFLPDLFHSRRRSAAAHAPPGRLEQGRMEGGVGHPLSPLRPRISVSPVSTRLVSKARGSCARGPRTACGRVDI